MAEVVFAIPGDIATPTGGYAYDREVLARLPGLGVRTRHVPLPASYPAPAEVDLALTEEVIGRLPAATVLLIDGLAFGAMPEPLVAGIRQPIIALVHHPLGCEPGLAPERARNLVALERGALAHARRVIATSPFTARLLATDYAVPPDRITVAIPGTRPAARARGTGRPPQLLAVGAVSPRKGYDVLVEALAGLPELDWQLTIAGALDRAPGAVAAVEEVIERNGLGRRIALPGSLAEEPLDRLYAAADVLVMPSLFEGYGMVLAEAMARGLPIVCTTGGAAAETVPEGAALKVPPGAVGPLAAALRRVLGEPALRQRLAEASWQAGRRLPDWDETARLVAGVIIEVAG